MNTESQIKNAIAGDQDALLVLLHEMSPDLVRFVKSKLATIPALNGYEDDVLQETYIRACKDISSLRITTRSGMLAWLRAVALNQIRDVSRRKLAKKRGGDRVRVDLDDPGYSDRALGLIVELSDPGMGTPSQFVARNEAVDAIRIALSQLPADQSRAIRLHCLQGMSLEEISQEMERSGESVRGLIRRGKEALRNAMMTSSLWLSRK